MLPYLLLPDEHQFAGFGSHDGSRLAVGVVVLRRHTLGVSAGAADDDVVADLRLNDHDRHDVPLFVEADRVAALAAAADDAEGFQPRRGGLIVLAGEERPVLADDGDGMLGAVEERPGQQLHAAVDDEEVHLVGELLVDDAGDDVPRVGYHKGSRLDLHHQLAAGGGLELFDPLLCIGPQGGDVGLFLARHAGHLEAAAEADGDCIREVCLDEAELPVDVLLPLLRGAAGADMDVDLGEAEPLLVGQGLHGRDVAQMDAEAGVLAAGVAGGALAAASGARMDPHGKVDLVLGGKVGDELVLQHRADVVPETGLDHGFQFGPLLVGGDLLGGEHHAAVGDAGGMGPGRLVQG